MAPWGAAATPGALAVAVAAAIPGALALAVVVAAVEGLESVVVVVVVEGGSVLVAVAVAVTIEGSEQARATAFPSASAAEEAPGATPPLPSRGWSSKGR
jgi:hypothetical protein